MARNANQRFSICINQALAALQQKNNLHAIALLEEADRLAPNTADVKHLLGVSYTRVFEFKTAKQYLQSAIKLQENNPQYHNSFGNCYVKMQSLESARACFKRAIKLKADYVDPYINLGNLLLKENNISELTKLIESWKANNMQNIRLTLLEAKLLSRKGLHSSATRLLAALQNQNNPAVTHALALEYRLMGQAQKALELYKQLEQSGFRQAVFFHNYANALSDLGRLEDALIYYQKALAISPFLIDTHSNLCDLRFELGHTSEMFDALYNAVNHPNCSAEIFDLFIEKLMRVKQYDGAAQIIELLATKYPTSSSAIYFSLLLDIKTNKANERVEKDLVNFAKNSVHKYEFRLECVHQLISLKQFEDAELILEDLLQLKSADQYALSLLYLCRRMLAVQDVEHQHLANPSLINLKDYVFEYVISPPDDYQDLSSYLEDLTQYLKKLHTSINQPLEQTLHKGTQTRGNLFDDTDPLIAHIRQQYTDAVADYISTKSHLPEIYPGFWQEQNVDFAGSWSVFLRPGGYHSNHIHPMGWLSSVCYIVVPDTSTNQEGWFKYGEPNLPNSDIEYEGCIKPERGKIVLFPSCLWHGTIPFKGKQERITIACDLTKMGILE